MKPEEDGQRFCAKVVEAIIEDENQLANQPEWVKFRCSVNDEQYDEIVTYNDILNHIEPENTELGTWKFKSITAHQGPLSKSDPNYNGCRWNVLVNWETGESTYKSLNVIVRDDPITCAIYGKEQNLLGEEG